MHNKIAHSQIANGPIPRAGGPAPAPSAASDTPSQTTVADAAAHGVIIGPNVHIGSNVIIGGSSPSAPPASGDAPAAAAKTSATHRADYDPRRFDPVAYLDRAEAIARELVPDARLTSFELDPVWPDGHVDLTAPGRDREFEFRSPSASARPANVPRNVAYERSCMIKVEVSPSAVTARVVSSETCDAPFVHHPRCHFTGVWQQALAAGTGRDLVARIGWLRDEQWFFDTDLGGTGGGVSSFPDRCP